MTALAPPPALAPWHILIIDDSPDDRAEMRQMLLRSSERRCRFTEAELGEAGLRAFRAMSAHPPDCILLDYNLPDMNAQQVLTELCAGADQPPCPIVVVTGSNTLPGQTLLRTGAQDYIGKSWTTAPGLLRAVENAIDRFALLSKYRRTYQKLQESEGQYRLLFDKNPDGVFVLDASGRFLIANPACETISGYPLAELLQKTFMEVCAPDQLAKTLEHFQHQLGKPSCAQWETALLRKDGRRVELWVTEEPLRSLGQLTVLHCTAKDVTERNHAEKRIAASLREKEVMLKEIHHRVKNNMQVISSLMDLQADGLDDPTLRQVLAEMRDRVRSMALVHEKLYQSDNLAQVDFDGYAQSLLGSLWRAHANSATTVELKLDLEPVPLSIVSAIPCGLLLNELAINALKHAFRGRTEGEVCVELRSDTEGRVRLSLRDNGVGMPAGQDWRRSPSLGLQLVRLLVEQLGGALEVKVGVGTKFELSFMPAKPEQREKEEHE